MKHVLTVAAVMLTACPLVGCNNRAARSLGHIAPTERRNWPTNADNRVELTDPALVATVDNTEIALLPIYRVDAHGKPTTKSTLKYGVFLMADVTMLEKHHYLGVPVVGGQPDATQEQQLVGTRQIIFQKLLNIAESNGQEYWRRLFGGMKYAEAVDAGSDALMGAGIASTFISPVLGASLTAAGAVSDAFSEELLSGFNPDLYKEVQTAMQHEVDIETARIRGKLEGSYDDYPATALVNDMVNLARMYSVEFGMKALEKANNARAEELETKKQAAQEAGRQETAAD